MLIGTYQRTLDSKMRFTLPADFRKELGDRVVLVSLKDALYGFTPEGFEEWVNSQFQSGDKSYDKRSLNDVRLMRGLTASAVPVDLDAAGRVSLSKLSQKKLDRHGIKKNVTVLGAADHFEVWDTETWEAEDDILDDEIFDLRFKKSVEG